MTSMHTSPTLADSFAELRSSAKSIDDVQTWFQENPSALLGDVIYPAGTKYKVEMRIFPDSLIEDAVDKEILDAALNIDLSYPMENQIKVRTGFASDATKNVTKFRQECYFEMHMQDWPLACAMITERFIMEKKNERDVPAFAVLHSQLNHYLATHFPGWSMEKLASIHSAELLPVDMEGQLQAGAIQDLLYNARATVPAFALPDLIA